LGEWIPIPLLNVSGADQFYIFRARFYALARDYRRAWLLHVAAQNEESDWREAFLSAPMLMYLLTCGACS